MAVVVMVVVMMIEGSHGSGEVQPAISLYVFFVCSVVLLSFPLRQRSTCTSSYSSLRASFHARLTGVVVSGNIQEIDKSSAARLDALLGTVNRHAILRCFPKATIIRAPLSPWIRPVIRYRLLHWHTCRIAFFFLKSSPWSVNTSHLYPFFSVLTFFFLILASLDPRDKTVRSR